MTLGGTVSGSDLHKGLEELEELWRLLLWSKGHYSCASELPIRSHRTAGILYYFEIRPGHEKPTPKVYIPVRHYRVSDIDTAKKLRKFMSKSKPKVDNDHYMRMLKFAL